MASKSQFFEPEIETLDRRKLERLQLERLRWQVKRCYEGSPFYRERLDKAGVGPQDIEALSDVRRLPVVTKQELREEQARFGPFGRYTISPPKDWREVHPTTGTTGAPIHNLWSERDVQNITRWTARTLWNFGVRPGDIVHNAFSYGLWVAGLSSHYGARELGCLMVPIGGAPVDKQIEYLAGVKPTVLLATPSFGLYIAERLKGKGATGSLALRVGCFGGEPGAEVRSTRAKLEAGLGIEAYDYYGLAEIGPTCASECQEKVGIHWVEDHVLVEVVNPQTRESCPPGEVGVLVLTSLTKEATPMLRYWTNDYARLVTERCACGRTHAHSPGGILGRADEMVVYRGTKFYPVQVEKVVRSFTELGNEFRVVLTTSEQGTDLCTVVAECASLADRDQLTERLRQALRDELQVTPHVEIVSLGDLERTTFKAKRLEDRRDKR
ncbi:MAG: phenylacetate--CoA ligase [Chloroflexota bacterium]|nr:phenylacetate--CoA ligase [Chloroflexota bacterium]